jgi:hypothetical protein
LKIGLKLNKIEEIEQYLIYKIKILKYELIILVNLLIYSIIVEYMPIDIYGVLKLKAIDTINGKG